MRIFESIPGAIKLLHFLQNTMRSSYGIRTLCLVLILRANAACRLDKSGLVLALEMALSISICIRSTAIDLRAGFTRLVELTPKNSDRLYAVTGI